MRKEHHKCDTYDWWEKHKDRLFIDVFMDWIASGLYNNIETAQVLKIYWKRFPSNTRTIMLQQLKQNAVKCANELIIPKR